MTSQLDTNQPPRLALVDDDPSVRRALGRLLRPSGFIVDLYSSAYAFLSQPESEWPDCAIVDVRMPGQTGIALVDTLRAIAARVPVILITGDADTILAERAATCGAVTLLGKPIEESVLLRAIAQAVRLKSHAAVHPDDHHHRRPSSCRRTRAENRMPNVPARWLFMLLITAACSRTGSDAAQTSSAPPTAVEQRVPAGALASWNDSASKTALIMLRTTRHKRRDRI